MTKEKETYLKEWKARLEEGKSDIDRLQEKMLKSQADYNPTLADFVDALQRNWNEREKEFQELEQQSGEAWEVLRDGFTKSFSELESAIKEATDKFSQKTEADK